VVVQAEAQLADARAMESKAQLAFDSVIDGENTSVAQVRAQLHQVEINLAFTTVAAPANGFVTNLQLREGSVAQAGQPVMSLSIPRSAISSRRPPRRLRMIMEK
jgi:multidrug resistance efflux pump